MFLRMVSTDLAMVKGPPFLVSGEKYRLGRSSECSFVINDLSVSRVHAEILVNNEGVLVKDLGSLNGTFVEGVRIGEAKVQSGQVVIFGSAQFRLAGNENKVPDDAVAEASTCAISRKVPSSQETQQKLQQLSEMQRLVLDYLLTGRSEKQVANKLDLSPHTVHNHVKEIHRKMGVTSRSELLALFVSNSKRRDKSGA